MRRTIKLEDLLVGDRVAILPSEGLIHRCHRLCIKGSVWILIHEFFIESNVGADVSQIVDSHTENSLLISDNASVRSSALPISGSGQPVVSHSNLSYIDVRTALGQLIQR